MAKTNTQITKKVPKTVQRSITAVWELIAWLTGVLVSLAVGFGMIGEGGSPTLDIPFIPDAVIVFAGWVVVLLTIAGALIALIDKITG